MAARIITAILVLSFMETAAAHAQLYVYTDKNGKTVYTDKPPENVESKPQSVGQDGISYSGGKEEQRATASVHTAPASKQRSAEQPKKNYHRVSVFMYMTSW